jgi:hypothetical protein
MAPIAAPGSKSSKASQPNFWKHYSPHGECPLSFVGSLLLHVLVPVGILLLLVWGPGSDGENSKPPQMDVVEVEAEGLGGGTGGTGVGPGALSTGAPGRHEGAASRKLDGDNAPLKIQDIKLKDLPPSDLKLQAWNDSPEAKDGDILAYLDRERRMGEQILANQEAAGSASKAGGAGGPKGPGFGKGQGVGQGTSKTGSILTDQRRRELRWKILASADGDVHLKKLQALKVTLLIPLRSKPGFALRYDLSKPSIQGEEIRFADDSAKVRWQNSDPKEMVALAKVLRLKEVPIVSVIYLPSALEKDMAIRELTHEGRQEYEIKETVWDVRERDGSFENEPYIVQQFLRPGVK